MECRSRFVTSQFRRFTAKSFVKNQRDILEESQIDKGMNTWCTLPRTLNKECHMLFTHKWKPLSQHQYARPLGTHEGTKNRIVCLVMTETIITIHFVKTKTTNTLRLVKFKTIDTDVRTKGLQRKTSNPNNMRKGAIKTTLRVDSTVPSWSLIIM